MKKKLLWLSFLLSCGALLSMEPESPEELQNYRSPSNDYDVAFSLAQQEISAELGQGQASSVRPNSNQLSHDESYARRLHRQLNGRVNPGRRAPDRNNRRSRSNQLSQDEAYARELQCQLNGQDNSVAEQGHRAPVRRPNSNQHQLSQDEAYARELQLQLDGQGNSVAEQGHRASDTRPNSNQHQLSQDEAYARELQLQLNGQGNPVAEQGHRDSDTRPNSNQHQPSQDEAYARELQRQLDGQGNPVAERGHRASDTRPNSNQHQPSQDEAYARELQRQLDGEGEVFGVEREASAERPASSNQLSQDEVYASELQGQEGTPPIELEDRAPERLILDQLPDEHELQGQLDGEDAPIEEEHARAPVNPDPMQDEAYARELQRELHPRMYAGLETMEKLFPEGKGRWVRLVQETVPGEIPPGTAARLSQVIAQEILRNGPPIRELILDEISLPKILFYDSEPVTAAVFNHAGDKAVTASYDGTARIWDTETGRLLRILEGHTGKVLSVAFNRTGDKVVIGSEDRTARIWDTETGITLRTLEGHTASVRSVGFNRTSDKVVTGSYDGTARIWDTETGITLRTLEGHTASVRSVGFNRTSDKVVTASNDTTARIWDTQTGTLLHILEGHTGGVFSAAFNRTGDKVVTGSSDRTARIWDVETGRSLLTLTGHIGSVYSAAFNRAGDKVVTGSSDRTARIWDTETGITLRALTGDQIFWRWRGSVPFYRAGHTGPVSSAVFNAAGDKVITASVDKTARVWNLDPFLVPRCEQFLNEDITLLQVAILADILEVEKARNLYRGVRGVEGITFDFNKYPQDRYPHLWEEYIRLPDAIRNICDPYITKPSSN